MIAVNRRGILIADSAGPAPPLDYSSRPEIRSALNGRGVQISRDSKTLGEEILATSAPVLEHGSADGAIRVTQSISAVSKAVHSSILDLAILAGVVLVLGLVAGGDRRPALGAADPPAGQRRPDASPAATSTPRRRSRAAASNARWPAPSTR